MSLVYCHEIADKCIELGYKRLLFERDIPVMMPFPDMIESAKEFLRMVQGIRVAFINSHPEIQDKVDLAILFGRNRGGNYKTFDNVQSAEEWLLTD